MKSQALALGEQDIKKVRTGIIPVLEAFKAIGALDNFIGSIQDYLDNTSNGTIVDMSNKSIPVVADSHLKLANFTEDFFATFVKTLGNIAIRNNDDSSSKQAQDIINLLEDSKNEYTKRIKDQSEIRITKSDVAQDSPITVESVLAMIESIKKTPKFLAGIYDQTVDFGKKAMSTQCLDGNDDYKKLCDKFSADFASIVNDEYLLVVQGYANNAIEFINQYRSIMTEEQAKALDEFNSVFQKAKVGLSESKSEAKKAKAEFASGKGF